MSHTGYLHHTAACWVMCRSILIVEAVCAPKKLANLYQTTWYYNPEDRPMNLHSPENFKHYTARVQNVSKNLGVTSNSRSQKGDMKQLPFVGPTNIRRHDSLASGICASLIYINVTFGTETVI
jgi:hypothetical protein